MKNDDQKNIMIKHNYVSTKELDNVVDMSFVEFNFRYDESGTLESTNACASKSDFAEECKEFDDIINELIDGEKVKINENVQIKGTTFMITRIPIMIEVESNQEAENLMNLFLVYKR